MVVFALSSRASSDVFVEHGVPDVADTARPFATTGAAALPLTVQNFLANACRESGSVHLSGSGYQCDLCNAV